MSHKKNSKIFLVLSLALVFTFIFGQFVTADGGVVIYDRDMWRLQDMKDQTAAINYENGMENMILSVNVNDFQGEKAVWIFPVPASPSRTAINIVSGFPRLRGYEVEKKLQSTISGSLALMALTQLFPFLPLSMMLVSMGGSRSGTGDYENVSVYEHMEKMGLTTELVTAENGSALNDYLAGKGLDLPLAMKTVLDDYAGKDYSFVVSWISNVEQFKEEQLSVAESLGGSFNLLGVSIIFPTNKIYFPLKTTSVYDSKRIPMNVYVMNHVTPELYQSIKWGAEVSYFVAEDYGVPEELSGFFNQKTAIADLKYTKIKIDSPSKYLEDDLWMENSAPLKVSLLFWINKCFFLFGILLFALISCAASLLAGLMVFGKEERSRKNLAVFGLWNFLTIVGFWMAAKRMGEKNSIPGLDAMLKKDGFSPNKKSGSFALAFSIVFLSMLAIANFSLMAVFR